MELNRGDHDGDHGLRAIFLPGQAPDGCIKRPNLLAQTLVLALRSAFARQLDPDIFHGDKARVGGRANGGQPGKDRKQGQKALEHRRVR